MTTFNSKRRFQRREMVKALASGGSIEQLGRERGKNVAKMEVAMCKGSKI